MSARVMAFQIEPHLSLRDLDSSRLIGSVMADATYPARPTSEEIDYLVTIIKDWSIAHGLAVRPPPAIVSEKVDPHSILATTAPVTLFPSPFPRICFDQALSIQEAYNELYASISQDEEFLKGIVEE
jgi:glutathione synthase